MSRRHAAHFKLQGRRSNGKVVAKVAKEGEPAEEPNTVSISQQSFDNQVDNFAKLIQTLTAETLYMPNEVELQIATLNTLLTGLRDKNKSVVTSTANLSNTCIARDKIMYADITGLYDIFQAVKQYVKSLYGASSPQNKQISGIKFTRPR